MAIVAQQDAPARSSGGVLPSGVSPHAEAWALTRRLSPRRTVRIAVHQADGITLNIYDATAQLDGPAPAGPWAMNLADDAGYYQWVVFDLDAKGGNTRADARRLASWLAPLGIRHLECASGPTGGRHLWVRAESLHPQLVAAIAHRAASLLPTLDKGPLTNAATGAVRPPLSPHRLRGRSEPLGRGTDPLAALDGPPTLTPERAEQLIALLDAHGAETAAPETAGIRGMVVDAEGHPHLQGARRTPTARIRALLEHGDPAQPDASITQAALLAGLARARWTYRDVLARLRDSPALEHARSVPYGGTRRPRPGHAPQRVLAASWRLAVRYVASNPLSAGTDDDTDFTVRATAIAETVHALQERANAQPGRWGAGGGTRSARARQGRPSHRAVLDAVCLYALQAVNADVEVDIRRLADDTGYGREACRLALLALTSADAGRPWLTRTADAEGPHAARYRLPETFSTGTENKEWSQGVTRPAPQPARASTAGPTSRTALIQELGTRLADLAHDVFTAPRSLGRAAGRALRSLPRSGTATVGDIAVATGEPADAVRRKLRRLHAHGLAERTDGAWSRSSTERRDAVAAQLGASGYLASRKARYDAERAVWAWWSAEVGWMRTPGKKRKRRAPGALPLGAAEPGDFPRYPRGPDGSPNHRQARLYVDAGELTDHGNFRTLGEAAIEALGSAA